MNEIIKEDYENVFKCESKKNIVSFVKAIETDINNEISSMIHQDFEILFELETLLLKLQKAMNKQDNYVHDAILINDNVDEIKEVIQKIKYKLLTIDKQKQKHQLLIDECFADTKICLNVLDCNKDLIQ